MCISLPASIKEACIQSITVPWRWTYPDGFNNVWWLEIWTGQFSNNNYVIVQKVRSPWLMVSMLDGHHHVVGIFEPLHRIIGSGRPSHTVNSWEGEGRRGKGGEKSIDERTKSSTKNLPHYATFKHTTTLKECSEPGLTFKFCWLPAEYQLSLLLT